MFGTKMPSACTVSVAVLRLQTLTPQKANCSRMARLSHVARRDLPDEPGERKSGNQVSGALLVATDLFQGPSPGSVAKLSGRSNARRFGRSFRSRLSRPGPFGPGRGRGLFGGRPTGVFGRFLGTFPADDFLAKICGAGDAFGGVFLGAAGAFGGVFFGVGLDGSRVESLVRNPEDLESVEESESSSSPASAFLPPAFFDGLAC